MANILYGVNGEGSGHSTRAKEVILHLLECGHHVKVVSFDRGLRNLGESFEVTEIYGLRFSYANNRVRYRRTLFKNLVTIPKAARSIARLSRLADEWAIELVISDFEPLSCQIAHRKRLPVISIDNQHCLTNARVSYPRKFARDAAAAKLVTRLMTPRADAYLATSFFPAQARRKNTFICPPILRREVLQAESKEGDHLLVYVTSPSEDLVRILNRCEARFIAYGFGRAGQKGNILFKQPGSSEFLRDLASCRAVIANAGFSLVSEALHLGKPYLAVPVKHQFEQIFNAYYLDRTGYGACWPRLNRARVQSFLDALPGYRRRLAEYPRTDNTLLFQKLDELILELCPATQKAGAGA